MQNIGNQQGQAMAPAIDYLNQVQRIYFDAWRRWGEAGARWAREAMDECNRVGQDMLHLASEGSRATADAARTMAALQADQLERGGQAQADALRQQAGELRAQADAAPNQAPAQHGADRHEGRHGKHEAGADKREGSPRGKGGQDNHSTVHQRAGG